MYKVIMYITVVDGCTDCAWFYKPCSYCASYCRCPEEDIYPQDNIVFIFQ